MATCGCGCGNGTNGTFAPGHDQKLRSALERRVGGLISLSKLVDAAEGYARGEHSTEEFAGAVRRLFWKASSKDSTSDS